MEIGDVILGRYELREALGGDEHGQVFRAMDLRELRDVVIKLFDAARCPADAVQRYAARVESAAQAKHPAIGLPRVEIGSDGAPSAAVEEIHAAQDLDTLRGHGGALPWRRAAEIVTTCAEALAALVTATGAAHRALRPSSVRVGEYGKIHIVDFGVVELGARPVPPRGDVHVEYRAPEQLEGAPGDGRSDVFALGVLLFELATGVHPFSGSSAFKATHKVLLQATPKPSEVAPASPLPAAVEGLILRALARKPADRFSDPGEFGKALALARRAAGDSAPTPAVIAPDIGRPRASEWRTLDGEARAIPLDALPSIEPEERTEQLAATEPMPSAVGRPPALIETALERTEVMPPPAGRPSAATRAAVERTEVLPAGGRSAGAARPASDPDETTVPGVPRAPAPVMASTFMSVSNATPTADDDGPTNLFGGSPAWLPTHASSPATPTPAVRSSHPELPVAEQTPEETTTQLAGRGAPGSLRLIVWINLVFVTLAAAGLAWIMSR